jgi:hypothetical protein
MGSRYEEFTAAKLIRTGANNGTVVVKETDGQYITKCECATGSIPSAAAGYKVGCILTDTTTGKLYYNSNSVTSCTFNSIADITTAEIGVNAITPIKMGTRTVVALSDDAATPTIAQLMTSSLFTMTPSTARTFTTPTAAEIVAGVTGATVGTWFDFTIVNLAAFAITVTAGSSVTLVGDVVVNKGSATYRAVLTNVTGSSETVSIYRMAAGINPATNMPLASGKVLLGQSTGLAAEVTLDTDISVASDGNVTIANNAITTVKILDGNVTAEKLANNAAGLNSVGMGASASYASTTNGVQTLATGTAGAKTCLFVVSVTESFVTDAANTQTTFKIGEVGTDDKFSVAALLTDATAGQIKVFSGALTASTNVIVTAVAAVGTGTGAIAVTAIILPTAS